VALRRLGPASKLQRGHINQFVRATDEAGRRISSLERADLQTDAPCVRAWAFNNTGGDLRMGDCAWVAGLTVSDMAEVVIEGAILELQGFEGSSVPDSPQWVVAADEIAEGEGGWVWIDGMVLARASGSGSYVDAPASGAVLTRGTSGSPILQECGETVAGDGEVWVLIRLTSPNTGASGGGASVGDGVPVIDSKAGAVGVSADALRDDTQPGLLLVGDPSDGDPHEYATLEFTVDGDVRTGGQVKYGSQSGLGCDGDGLLVDIGDGLTQGGGNTITVDYAGTVTTVDDLVGAVGTDLTLAREDHKHPFNGANFAGAGITWSDEFINDYSPATNNPEPVDGTAASKGTQAAKFAWEDHIHYLAAAIPLAWSGGWLTLNTGDLAGDGLDYNDLTGALDVDLSELDHETLTNKIHDGDTLQCAGINSNDGAFAFDTTGTVTFSQNVKLSNTMDLECATAGGSDIFSSGTPGGDIYAWDVNATKLDRTATDSVDTAVTIQRGSTGTVDDGFGSGMLWDLEDDGGTQRNAGRIDVWWTDVSNDYAQMDFYVRDTTIQKRATLYRDGVFDAVGGFSDNGTPGIDTTFLDQDGNTITVNGGIITAKTAP